MKKLLIACMLFAGGITQASAQDLTPEDFGYFNHLCGGITLGTDGIGFERLILFVTGMQNIRDVIPFPRTPKSAEF